MSWLGDVIAWFGDSAHWHGPDGVLVRLGQHVAISAVSVAVACALALPVALWLGHLGRGGALAVNVSNVGRAVPTFAALVLLALTSLGFGTTSTVVALVLFAIPPVLTNAYVGMREVDRDVVEAARGMGYGEWRLLREVELPLALPLVVTGIRLCAVQVVATATIAALVAGPGLGRIITAGYGLQDQAQVVAGALLVAALALLTELALGLLQRRTRVPGTRPGRPGRAVRGEEGTGEPVDVRSGADRRNERADVGA